MLCVIYIALHFHKHNVFCLLIFLDSLNTNKWSTRIMSSYNYFSVSWLRFTPRKDQTGSSRSVRTDFNMSPGFVRMKKDDLQIMRCACRALAPACEELHSCVSLSLHLSPGVPWGGGWERAPVISPVTVYLHHQTERIKNTASWTLPCKNRQLKTTGIRGFSLLHIMSVWYYRWYTQIWLIWGFKKNTCFSHPGFLNECDLRKPACLNINWQSCYIYLFS